MIVDDAKTVALIERVRDVARAEIMPRFRHLSPGDIDTKSGPDDLVAVADRAAANRAPANRAAGDRHGTCRLRRAAPPNPGTTPPESLWFEEAGDRARKWHEPAHRDDRSSSGLFVTGGETAAPWADIG